MLGPVALYNRSLNYLNGDGVAKDEVRAFALNAQSAALDYGDAILAMGWFYVNGVGVDVDVAKAQRWYRKSARKGEARAMFSLGQIAYWNREHDEALVWFTRALRKGHARSGYWIGKLHWHGRGVRKNESRAMALIEAAAAAGDPEANRTLRLFGRPNSFCGREPAAAPRPVTSRRQHARDRA